MANDLFSTPTILSFFLELSRNSFEILDHKSPSEYFFPTVGPLFKKHTVPKIADFLPIHILKRKNNLKINQHSHLNIRWFLCVCTGRIHGDWKDIRRKERGRGVSDDDFVNDSPTSWRRAFAVHGLVEAQERRLLAAGVLVGPGVAQLRQSHAS